jgi:hypothetical protein
LFLLKTLIFLVAVSAPVIPGCNWENKEGHFPIEKLGGGNIANSVDGKKTGEADENEEQEQKTSKAGVRLLIITNSTTDASSGKYKSKSDGVHFAKIPFG